MPQLSREEQIVLAAWVTRLVEGNGDLVAPKLEAEWERIRGIVADGPDPLEYQQRIRSEWDRESASLLIRTSRA